MTFTPTVTVTFATEAEIQNLTTIVNNVANAPTSVVSDTNVTLSLVSNVLTAGWAGTLAAGRLNSNVVQGVTNDTNVTGSISAQNLTLGWTGTLAAGRLNANVVQGVTNDTNVTGSIASQNLTLGWTGQLGVARGGTASSTLTAHAVLLGEGTSALGFATVGTSGRLLIDQGAADPTFNAMSGDATITNTGALTVAANAITNAKMATMANQTIKSNISGATAVPSDNTLTAILDNILGSARGNVIVRGASTWGALALGSNTQVLTSNGTDVVWAAASGGGGAEVMAYYGIMGGL